MSSHVPGHSPHAPLLASNSTALIAVRHHHEAAALHDGFGEHTPMFKIEITRAESTTGVGEIVIDEYSEEFEVDLSFWSPSEYVASWRRAIGTLLRDGSPTALITSLSQPDSANFLFWWVLYPLHDGLVAVQEQLLMFDGLEPPFSLEHPNMHIPEREIESEDGEPISEWPTSLAQLQGFFEAITNAPQPA